MISTILQSGDGDFVLLNGQLQIERRPYAVAAIKIRNRLRIWLGEWYANRAIGMPYVQKIFAKGVDPAIVRRMFQDAIMSMTPIVKEVTVLNLERDPTTRRYRVYFEALADNDQVLTGGFDGEPFVILEGAS